MQRESRASKCFSDSHLRAQNEVSLKWSSGSADESAMLQFKMKDKKTEDGIHDAFHLLRQIHDKSTEYICFHSENVKYFPWLHNWTFLQWNLRQKSVRGCSMKVPCVQGNLWLYLRSSFFPLVRSSEPPRRVGDVPCRHNWAEGLWAHWARGMSSRLLVSTDQSMGT